MSKKHLARTAIESGRYWHNCFFRRASHRIERAREREWLHRAKLDPRHTLATSIEPKPHVMKDFRDKLAPCERWLRAQAGRPWNDVFSEITDRFDTRTTAGRHILYDHILTWVHPRYGWAPREFWVDEDGVLRWSCPQRRKKHKKQKKPTRRHRSEFFSNEPV